MSVRDLVQNTRHRDNETEEFKLSKISVISFDHKKQNEFSMSHENVAHSWAKPSSYKRPIDFGGYWNGGYTYAAMPR